MHDNRVLFYSKFEEFLVAERYTDVIIECEGQIFKCHRLVLAMASPYFHSMFAGSFRESKENVIALQQINAETFSKVLEFIYTGELTVNFENLYDLLLAGDYFGLVDFEDLCLRFIQKNKIIGEAIFDLYAFATRTGKESLRRVLSEDIAAQLRILSEKDQFLNMPFDDLCAFFEQLSPINTDVHLAAVIKWVDYSREERYQYYHQIFQLECFENVSMEYLRFICSNVYNTSAIVSSSYSDENLNLLGTFTVPREPSLYICVKEVGKSTVNVFNILNESRVCSVFDTMNMSNTNPAQWIRNAVVDDFYVYSLDYTRRSTADHRHQSFHLRTSVNMSSAQRLDPPPLIFGDVSICSSSQNRSLYVYNHTLSQPVIRTTSLSIDNFNEETISCGIYQYHCELDRWFPMPGMHSLVEDACMVNCGGVLYLIGGKDAYSDGMWTSKEFQAYDHRTGIWHTLPSCWPYHVGADCCVLDGKIYVCGGSRDNGDIVDIYNTVSGRWEDRAIEMERPYYQHKVVSFGNAIWAMGNNCYPPNQTSIDVYYPVVNEWRNTPLLTNAIQENFPGKKMGSHTILDCFVV